MGGANERRTTRRYDLSLPVLVRIPTEKESDSKKGNTRDISTRGLYFVMDQDPQAGSQLDLVLTLPTAITNGKEVLVHAFGRVLRSPGGPVSASQRSTHGWRAGGGRQAHRCHFAERHFRQSGCRKQVSGMDESLGYHDP